jgi:ketosteroid isomerase-like protein
VSENLDLMRRAYDEFIRTGELDPGLYSPDFVWDMSEFRGWPERQTYPGVEGGRTFLREWREAWDDWTFEVESLHDAGDELVAVVRQSGKSKTSGLPVDMRLAQVWTLRDGKLVRMRMYADPAEAFAAVGLPVRE